MFCGFGSVNRDPPGVGYPEPRPAMPILDFSLTLFKLQRQIEYMIRWFEVSNQTARNDLNDLVEKGILQARKSGKKIQFLITRDAIKKLRYRKV